MISKERFVKVVNFIKKMHKVEEDINDVFENNNMEFNRFSFCEYENELFELLSDCMNDKDDLICWWLYDTNCGDDVGEDNRIWEDAETGEKIDLTTIEQLYDYLVKSIDNELIV